MSFNEPAGRRISRRLFLVGGLALATAVASGCGALDNLIASDPDQPIYRSQVTPDQRLDENPFASTAAGLEARLRFLAGDGVAVRQVHDGAADFFLVEVSSVDVPQFDALILDRGVVSLMTLPAGAVVDEPVPAGAEMIVDNVLVAEDSVRVDDPGTGPTLEFVLVGDDADSLAGATAVPDQTLGVVVDGIVRFAATVQAPITGGSVAIVSPERPELLSVIGAILVSGPLASDLSAAEGGQILFD